MHFLMDKVMQRHLTLPLATGSKETFDGTPWFLLSHSIKKNPEKVSWERKGMEGIPWLYSQLALSVAVIRKSHSNFPWKYPKRNSNLNPGFLSRHSHLITTIVCGN